MQYLFYILLLLICEPTFAQKTSVNNLNKKLNANKSSKTLNAKQVNKLIVAKTKPKENVINKSNKKGNLILKNSSKAINNKAVNNKSKILKKEIGTTLKKERITNNNKKGVVAKKNIVTKKVSLATQQKFVSRKAKTAEMLKKKIGIQFAKSKETVKPITNEKSKFVTKNIAIKKTKDISKTIAAKSIIVKAQKEKLPIIKEAAFAMQYPFYFNDGENYIKYHFGKIKIEKLDFNNQSLTFELPLETEIVCNIDTSIVSDLSIDEDSIYTISLIKNNYIIVFNNLKEIQVAIGDTVIKNQALGTIAPNEMNTEMGLLDLMLFKNNKVINPEKFIKKEEVTIDIPESK